MYSTRENCHQYVRGWGKGEWHVKFIVSIITVELLVVSSPRNLPIYTCITTSH